MHTPTLSMRLLLLLVCCSCCCVAAAASRPVKKRSEVDRRLEQLVMNKSWKLKEPSKQSVIKVSGQGGAVCCANDVVC